jgi:hypothetical protein
MSSQSLDGLNGAQKARRDQQVEEQRRALTLKTERELINYREGLEEASRIVSNQPNSSPAVCEFSRQVLSDLDVAIYNIRPSGNYP